MNPVKIQAIARKEFYHLIRDLRSLYLAFAIPLFLILLFGYALSLDVDNIKTVAMDHDKTSLSRDLIHKLDASSYFNVIRHLPNTKEVTRYLDHGWATMAIVIPPGWTKNIKADREAPIQILLDGSDPNFASISLGYITKFVGEYNNKLLFDFLDRKNMEKIKPPVEGQTRVWFNENLESRNFILPGIIAIIIMIVGAMLTSLVIAREYENGTIETIFSLPVGAGEFLTGKAIPYFFIGLTDVLIAVLMGQVFFGIIMKSSFWLMVLASSIYLFVALSLGLLISIITKSQLVANQYAVLVTYLPSLLLSDFVFPIVSMPKVLQLITYIVPARYYIDILNGLYLRNLGMAHLWPSYTALIAMFIILAFMNLIALKREGM